ncbi:MAG TPA: 2Fe-2S iron-sulfur cluster-binding protein [Sphingobacteriaceae bacterium]
MESQSLLHFRITGIKDETPVAKTYRLQEIDGNEVRFLPGQFLTVIIETEKQELRRSYSILSLPGEPLQITVKKVTNGLISRFILQRWQVGMIITSLPPAGRFTLRAQHGYKRDIFCFAAGSGIVPILPQIRYLLDAEPQSVIHLIYSNHNETDSLFLHEIDGLTAVFEMLKVHLIFSEPLVRKHQRGRLSNVTVEPLIGQLLTYRKKDAVFLLCGPFTYMRMLSFTLGLMHFPKDNIRKENFIPEIMRSGHVSKPVFPDRWLTVEHDGKQQKVMVKSGETILKAVLDSGINPPYSCDGGVCGTCAAKCKKGQVYMTINEVLTDAELAGGWVLTCTGYPSSEDTVIEFYR